MLELIDTMKTLEKNAMSRDAGGTATQDEPATAGGH